MGGVGRWVEVSFRLDAHKRRRSVHRAGAQCFESALARLRKQGGAIGCLLRWLHFAAGLIRDGQRSTVYYVDLKSASAGFLAGFFRSSLAPLNSVVSFSKDQLPSSKVPLLGALGRKPCALGAGASRREDRVPDGGEHCRRTTIPSPQHHASTTASALASIL